MPVIYLRHLLALAEDCGCNPVRLATESGIHRLELEADDGVIDFRRCDRLVTLTRALTGRADLGWQLGLRLNLMSHGAIAIASMTSDTVRDAMHLTARFLSVRFPVLQMSVSEYDDQAVIQFDEIMDLELNRTFYIDAFVATYLTLRAFLFPAGSEANWSIRLAFPRPEHHIPESFKDCQVLYEQSSHQFRFPASYLDRRMPMADPITCESSERQCQRILDELKIETGLLARVLIYVRSREGTIPSLELTAEYLNMSPRTLRRQLQEHNMTYRGLINKERQRLALHYLRNTCLTVEDIALKLDYNDPSNFGRAFRKWTGHSPGFYRRPEKL